MFNPMERIRKLANMPSLKGGYPPATHRKCSDWASYIDAVDTVTRELVDQVISCQQSALVTATDKAILAGKLAELTDDKAQVNRLAASATVNNIAITHDLPTGVREDLVKAAAFNGERKKK